MSSTANQTSVYRFASGGQFGHGLHNLPAQLGLHAERTVQGVWGSSEMSPSGMPRFRNPALASSGIGSPAGRPCSLSSSAASSPDSSRVASPAPAPAPAYNSTSFEAHTIQMCRCQRPQSLIMCSTCGFTFNGRVRSPCSVHPGQIYLMDNESCPGCGSACLREYTDTS